MNKQSEAIHLATSDKPKKKDRYAKEKQILKLLRQQFPNAFMLKDVKPLKIGVFEDLKKILDNLPEAPFSITECRKALRFYTRSPFYQKALAEPNAMRINLQGKPVGEVEPAHAEYGKVKHEWWLQRKEAKEK